MISRLHFVRKVVKLFVRLLACLAVGIMPWAKQLWKRCKSLQQTLGCAAHRNIRCTQNIKNPRKGVFIMCCHPTFSRNLVSWVIVLKPYNLPCIIILKKNFTAWGENELGKDFFWDKFSNLKNKVWGLLLLFRRVQPNIRVFTRVGGRWSAFV